MAVPATSNGDRTMRQKAYTIEKGGNAFEGPVEEIRARDDLLREYLSVSIGDDAPR